jgi:hypothetical protein
MPFASMQEMEERLTSNPSKLNQQELRDLIPWMRQVSEGGMRRLNVELALQGLETAHQFEKSSRKLTTWLVWLTAGLLALTLVTGYYTCQLVQISHQVMPKETVKTPAARK